MSKQLFVDPNQVRKPETLSFPPIPVNEYQKTVKDEKKKDVIGPDGEPVMDFDANSRKYGYIRKPEEFELMLA